MDRDKAYTAFQRKTVKIRVIVVRLVSNVVVVVPLHDEILHGDFIP